LVPPAKASSTTRSSAGSSWRADKALDLLPQK
jgi:hypothetical protein